MSSESDTENKTSDREDDQLNSEGDADGDGGINFEGKLEKPVVDKEDETVVETLNDEIANQEKKYDPEEIMLKLNVPRHEDITLMINSTVPFLIDGDALIMHAFLQENHEITLGGQYLHVIYYCERFLNLLLEKGGNFIIVFFGEWANFWRQNAYISCLRISIYKHLKENTDYKILYVKTFNDQTFTGLVKAVQPRCILLDLSYHLNLEEFNERTLSKTGNKLFVNVDAALLINCIEIIYFRFHDLPCIDVSKMDFQESVVFAFNLPSINIENMDMLKSLYKQLGSTVQSSPPGSPGESIVTVGSFAGYDARRAIVVIASSKFLSIIENTNSLQVILLYYAALEVLHLENRCCPIFLFKEESLEKVQDIVVVWLNCMTSAIKHCLKFDFTWSTIGDIWQGTMFSYICHLIQNGIYIGSELGHFQEAYENYIEYVETESGLKIQAYPIVPFCQTGSLLLIDNELEKPEEDKPSLYLLNNSVIRTFCGNTYQNVKWAKPPSNLVDAEFDETKHWHCRKPLTDDYDRQKEDDIITDKRWKQKQEQYFARFLNMYGTNLNGGIIKSEAVICQQDKKEKKKAAKESKKAAEIKQKNLDVKEQENLKKDNEVLKKLKDYLKVNATIHDFEKQMDRINRDSKNLKTNVAKSSANMLKLKTYRQYIKDLKPQELNTELIKEIFIIIRGILQNNHDQFKEKDKFISKFLHELGLKEIANRNNLPMDVTFDPIMDLNWIRFQLEHMGPEMERLSGSEYDADIGFTPDPWQTEFIQAIRRKQSALVVAPTSSGKTFAAYYCMKRVLQESEDGIIVYVAPTKALVNQVEATVYAKFKRTDLRDGKAIVGVFTRDYKRNALNSRILVTVPQCLDILLLSPRRYTWIKNLKYVIFDEVHKLSGSDEAIVWERCLLLIRCPFLALSATISDVNSFHKWLQANENFKRAQDEIHGKLRDSYKVVLVEYNARHSDLIKYVYSVETDLQHYHPYSALNTQTLINHNGIPHTINLAPREVLQLFDVMSLNNLAKSKLKNKRDILTFFSETSRNGFIKRAEVVEYEKIIARVFCEVHEENEQAASDIIKHLQPPKHLNISGTKEITDLLYNMHRRNLLPCIIFSYNRDCIELSDFRLVQACKKDEAASAVDSRTEKMNEKIAKKEKKTLEKSQGGNKDTGKVGKAGDRRSRPPTNKSSLILRNTGSKFKGEGIADADDLKLIEKRLARTDYKPLLVHSLPYGIAYHHGGLNNIMRSTVEILFRMGILKVVFATGTLALGIHMPCKSIVVFGDSPFLNSLEFHQMSGRAGRRGFDTEGNVIFMGLSKKRQDTLMTDKLPKMLGNFPVTISLIARILLLVTKVTDKGKSSEEVTNIVSDRILALLENSLIFQFKPNLRVQLKHFVDFAAQLLFIQGHYNADGVPLKLASVVIHLHYHEPSNLVFAHLLRTGALRQLLLSIDNNADREWALIIVLSHLFARLRLHELHKLKTFNNSKVILEPLPEPILEAIEEYNKEVKFVFDEYFLSVATYLDKDLGKDNTLPVSQVKFTPIYTYKEDEEPDTLSAQIKSSCVKRIACSSFIALSGNNDKNLYTGTMISNIRHEICPGIKVVPLLNTDVVHNSYAADFYRHGIINAIMIDNGLRAGAEFTLLKDFLLVLKAIIMCLEELEPVDENDPIYMTFKSVSKIFDQKFMKAFYRK